MTFLFKLRETRCYSVVSKFPSAWNNYLSVIICVICGEIRRPTEILIPCDEIRIQRFLVFGEGHAISLEDGFVVHLLNGDSALHAGHGGDELGEVVVAIHIVGRKKIFLSTDACNLKHRSDVGFRVVLPWWRPSRDNIPHRESPTLMGKAFVIGLEDAPCRPIAIGHALELYKTLVFLLCRSTLPFVGRVSDVEWVVVSDSSCLHIFCVLFLHHGVHGVPQSFLLFFGTDDTDCTEPVLCFTRHSPIGRRG